MTFTEFFIVYKWSFLFYAVLLLLIFLFRKKFEHQGILSLYKTKIGLRLMEKISSKHREFVKWLGYISIGVSYIGLLFIAGYLTKNLLDLIINPATQAAVTPVLPGFRVPGTTIILPLVTGWIALFIVILVHEFSHGVVARAHDIKVKSSGIFFMGPLMGAFVEPEEKKLKKRDDITQYSIFAIAPFSNAVLAVICALLLSFVVTPIGNSFVEPVGFELFQVTEGFPAEQAGLKSGMFITQVNGEKITTSESFFSVMEYLRPEETITISTDQGNFEVITTNRPDNEKQAYIGILGDGRTKLKNNSLLNTILYRVISWFSKFLFWTAVLSFGIGLVNLFPIFITDGARMLQVTLQQIKGPERGNHLWKKANMFCLFILFAIASIALVKWIFKFAFV